jgi:YidC/Oxa1 family membrane protein insertase
VWQQEGSGALSPSNPVTLKYDNGEGLTFRAPLRSTTAISSPSGRRHQRGSAPVTLHPFASSRATARGGLGLLILHEGLIGYLGEKGPQEHGYKSVAGAPCWAMARGALSSM